MPQKAVLSPTLFSISLNDIPATYDNKKDQFSLIRFGKATKAVEKEANKYLNELEECLRPWRLKFAPHKCSLTIFAKSKKEKALNLNIRMYGCLIKED